MKNKIALITGGASGLGKATCIDLATRGVNIAVADRNIDEANKTAMECINFGVKSIAY
jgi:NAD(P)-dependent dehydrogenase (short-subunit alcohol dehydrogenase family)